MRKTLIGALMMTLVALPGWAVGASDLVGTPHVAPHGGQLIAAEPCHFEFVSRGTQTLIYLFDEQMKPLPVRGRTGDIVLQVDGKIRRMTLVMAGDAFLIPVDLRTTESYVAVISVTANGKTLRGRLKKAPH